jgi:Na+/H+ antiporter NhaD/arsenite permease-like protein
VSSKQAKIIAEGVVMESKYDNFEDEISDLKQELEHFQQEKERVRAIIGKIGGVPKFQTKLINIIFVSIIMVSVVISIIGGEGLRLLMIELATVTLSAKIIYMIHLQMRINHFQFWILSSIEWRINETIKHMKEIKQRPSL